MKENTNKCFFIFLESSYSYLLNSKCYKIQIKIFIKINVFFLYNLTLT